MGVYSTNRTSLEEGSIDFTTLEGYNCTNGASMALIEGAQMDQEMFNAVIATDFAIAEAAGEDGIVTEAQVEIITEGTVQNIIDKIKALLEKLMGVIAGITKSFTAKLAGLLIRDNKTLVTALKKRLNRTDFSKFEAKIFTVKKDMNGADMSLAKDKFMKYYSDAGNVTTKAALDEMKEGLTDQVEAAYGAIVGNGSCKAGDFKTKLHESLFDKEPTTVTGMGPISEAVKELEGYKTFIGEINKAEKEVKTGATNMVKKAKEIKKSASSTVAEGKELSEAAVATLKYDIASAYRTTVLSIFKAIMTEIKFTIKQSRSLVVKAAAYTPKAAIKEDVELYDALTEASDFEVDSTFEEPGMPVMD